MNPSDAKAKEHTRAGFLRRGTAEGDVAERALQRPTDRRYNWQKIGVNPKQHRFGYVPEKQDDGGVASALTEPETGTLGKDSEWRRKNAFRLGQGRVKEGKVAELGRNFVYGRPKTEADRWGAADCVGGMYTAEEMKPDADLGKSRRKMKYNLHVPNAETRVFGVPSARSDLPAPDCRKISDMMNYGNEPSGEGLLYPERFAYTMGVTDDDFCKSRPGAEMLSIFKKSLGISFQSGTYEKALHECRADFTVQQMMVAYNKHS